MLLIIISLLFLGPVPGNLCVHLPPPISEIQQHPGHLPDPQHQQQHQLHQLEQQPHLLQQLFDDPQQHFQPFNFLDLDHDNQKQQEQNFQEPRFEMPEILNIPLTTIMQLMNNF